MQGHRHHDGLINVRQIRRRPRGFLQAPRMTQAFLQPRAFVRLGLPVRVVHAGTSFPDPNSVGKPKLDLQAGKTVIPRTRR